MARGSVHVYSFKNVICAIGSHMPSGFAADNCITITEQGDGITEEELVGMVDQAETEGGLDSHESDLIRNAIEFNDMEVSEILTPRVDLTAIEEDDSMEALAALFAESGFSRIPVYHETIDNIVLSMRRTSTPPAIGGRPCSGS